MSDEDALLAAVAADPAAALPRLVYADWLDDRGRAAEAELLRLGEHLAVRSTLSASLLRFRSLAARCAPDWLARVARPEVARCGLRFQVACPRQWADLAPTADPAVRHCDGCNQRVYLCTGRAEAHRRADRGQCVAVDARLVDPAGLPPGPPPARPTLRLGRPAPPRP